LAADARPLDRRVVITALGIAQILAWGTSFYFPAVFAEPIVKETGWSLGFVVGGTSIGLLTAGLISPQVGRIIDVRGGRPVLLASSLFYAAGLALVGLSHVLPVYLLAWVLIGLGMGTGLYDARLRCTRPHVWQRSARAHYQPDVVWRFCRGRFAGR
jgi:MFS family permease